MMTRIGGSILLVAEVTGNLALFYLSALLLGIGAPLSLVPPQLSTSRSTAV
jgi:hypothetical protein